MREEINRILKLVEDGKLKGDQASDMIEALRATEDRARGGRRHRGRRQRHGQRGFGGLFDELGSDLVGAVEDALRGLGGVGGLAQVFGGATGGEDWVDESNKATLAKPEEPTGHDFKVEDNRIVVSELARLKLVQAEFCGNAMHAAALQDVEVLNGPFNRNVLRGSSLKRSSFAASDATGNEFNGASLKRLSITSSVFKDNRVNGTRIRELKMQSAEVRGTRINGSKLARITLSGGSVLDDSRINGVVADDWEADASALVRVKLAGKNDEPAHIRGLVLRGANLTDCSFVGCTFDATAIEGVTAADLRFEDVDFTGMRIGSVEQLTELAVAHVG